MGLDRPVLVRYVECSAMIAAGRPRQVDAVSRCRWRISSGRASANTAMLAPSRSSSSCRWRCSSASPAGMREGSPLDRAILIFSRSSPRSRNSPSASSSPASSSSSSAGSGHVDAGGGGAWSVASQFVLPVAVIVLFDVGYVVSMIRASMIEVMQRPYIRTATLKGMSFRRVVARPCAPERDDQPDHDDPPPDQLPRSPASSWSRPSSRTRASAASCSRPRSPRTSRSSRWGRWWPWARGHDADPRAISATWRSTRGSGPEARETFRDVRGPSRCSRPVREGRRPHWVRRLARIRES